MSETQRTSDPDEEKNYDGDLKPLLRWVLDQHGAHDVELVCAAHGNPGRGARSALVVQLPGCVAAVSAASYLELIAAGLTDLTVAVADCPRADVTARTIASAVCLLHASGSRGRLSCVAKSRGRRREVFSLHQLPLSRRRLLMMAVPHSDPVTSESGTERDRTISALHTLQAPERAPSPDATAGLAAVPDGLAALPVACADLVATECTGCGLCERACPERALRVEHIDGERGAEFALMFTAQRCTDCGRCTDLCPDNALTRIGALSWNALVHDTEVRALTTGPVRECSRCHVLFGGPSDQTFCRVCAFRMANPFGSHVPTS